MKRLIPLLAFACASAAAQGADINKGRTLFTSHCAGCHGPNGMGLLPGTPNFRQGQVLMRPDSMLVESIRAGRNAMPAFRGMLTDAQLLDVVAFLRTLQ
jgi:cytochrome c6